MEMRAISAISRIPFAIIIGFDRIVLASEHIYYPKKIFTKG